MWKEGTRELHFISSRNFGAALSLRNRRCRSTETMITGEPKCDQVCRFPFSVASNDKVHKITPLGIDGTLLRRREIARRFELSWAS